MPAMKRCALYCRVSTAQQSETGTSLTTQLLACQQYAASQGFVVVYEVQEDASGAKLHRQGLDEVRDMAQSGSIDVVVVNDPDRLTRDLGHLMLLVDEFERARVELVFVNAPRENTPEGMMLLQMRGMFAQYERLKIEERTRRGKERKIKEGAIYMSRTCSYGYTYLVGQGKVEVLESEAYWVRRIFEWAAEGLSLRAIVAQLHGCGVKTKRGAAHWHPNVIRQILTNEIYAGVWHYGKRKSVEPRRSLTGGRTVPKETRDKRDPSEWLSAKSPAIIERSLFERVQPQLQRNRLMSPRNSRWPYLLRGLIVCLRCGYRMYGHHKVSGRWTRLNYECTGRYVVQPHVCDQPSLLSPDVEALVWSEVVRQLRDSDLLERAVALRASTAHTELARCEAELAALAGVERAVEEDKNKFLDLYQSDIIDRETLHTRMVMLRHRQEAASASRANVVARMAGEAQEYDARLRSFQSITEETRIALPGMEYRDKRAFLLGFDVRVEIDGHSVTIHGLIETVTLTLKTRYKPRPRAA